MARPVTWVFAMVITAAVGFSAWSFSRAQDPASAHAHSEQFAVCAKACADCMDSCASCYRHCSELLAAGEKEHEKSMNLCNDCADFCALAAKLTSRQSSLSILACEACAKACDQCAAACGKYPDDKHMAECAKACVACAKACREMVNQLSQQHNN
jgi:hypothetical protein